MDIYLKDLDGTPSLKTVMIDVEGQASNTRLELDNAIVDPCHTFTLVRNFGKLCPLPIMLTA
jgi:hypothetical protein